MPCFRCQLSCRRPASRSRSGSIERWVTSIYLRFGLIRIKHEPFNRLAGDESIHNLRDVRDRNAAVKEVIGFD